MQDWKREWWRVLSVGVQKLCGRLRREERRCVQQSEPSATICVICPSPKSSYTCACAAKSDPGGLLPKQTLVCTRENWMAKSQDEKGDTHTCAYSARMHDAPIRVPIQHTCNGFTHLQNLDFKVVKMNIWKEERDLWEGRESHTRDDYR